MDEQAEATRETAEVDNQSELVKLWLDAINLSSKEEEDWRKQAQETVEIYRNSKKRPNVVSVNDRTFNILHSNIETIIPAVYNSTPIPDVRRRFGDDDKAGKECTDIIERSLSFSVDSYDFDEGMKHDVKDMELTGRGLSRVRYLPYLTGQEAPDEEVQESGQELNESLTYEEVACEHVPWKHFRRGPARIWADVPWIAFELFLTRDELLKLSPKDGGKVNLDVTLDKADDKRDGDNVKEVFKRARVWEIWDKESRKVIFIAESFKDKPIKTADDPLELMGFFPLPRPLYAIETSDTLVPVVPYDIYRDQAEELERVSRRIMALVESIKSRGIYDGSMVEIQDLTEADDNELIAVENAVRYADGAGLEKGISWWPIEAAVKALQQLVEHRENIKNTIYEITGISDILRGETQASETATAQNIKQQWGSLRIQNKQANIQRYARDLFRLKAEIIANKFQWQTITLMTGLDYPPMQVKQQAQMAAQQAQQMGQPVPPQLQKILEQPAQEEIEQLLRNDAARNFRVDVESDSTIRADLTRNQKNMSEFLQGTAQFAQAMGPIVMTFKEMTPAVLEVYSAFARNFKLGKQAEDALDNISEKAREASEQPQQPPPPDPKIELEKEKLASDQQRMQGEMQLKAQEMQMKAQEAQQKQAEREQDMAARAQETQLKREELEIRKQELQLKAQEAAMKLELDRQVAEQKAQQDAQQAEQKAQLEREQADKAMEMERQKNELAQVRENEKHQLATVDQQLKMRFAEETHRDDMAFSKAEKTKKLQAMDEQQRIMREAHAADQRRADAEAQSKEKRAADEVERAKKPKVTKFKRGKDGKVEAAITEH